MGVLLAPDTVTLWAPEGVLDEHGWVQLGVPTVAWSGAGNVQELATASADGTASDPGGSGPYEPVSLLRAVAYLPLDAPASPGMQLQARDRTWLVTAVRIAVDPVGKGLDCLVCDCSEQGGETWPS